MSEKKLEGHKRSKSSLAISFLHRDKSKTDLTDDASSAVLESPTTSTHGADQGLSPLTPSRSKQPQRFDSYLSAPSEPGSVVTPMETATLPRDPSMTIEQSVRMFRLFEVLRSGDKAAISRAVKESSSDKSQIGETTIIHLAMQCADASVVEQVLTIAQADAEIKLDINAQDRGGNTPLHIAAKLGRAGAVQELLKQKSIDSIILNYDGRSALDLARTPDIFQQLQLARAIFTETQIQRVHGLVAKGDYGGLEKLLEDPKVTAVVDVNGGELATDPATVASGGTLLHEAASKRDLKLCQLLLLHGADPFRRDRRGRLPQDATKDEKTRSILKRSPAATAAQRGIQEKAILGSNPADKTLGGKESREMKGYLKKWTNYTTGYKLRWFVLEDGVLSYYKSQDDAGSACRGAMNMRIASLSMDAQDKTKVEVQGKASVKYHLKANHSVEAKRWFWALNNAVQWAKDEAKQEAQREKQDQAKYEQQKQDLENADAKSETGGRYSGSGLIPATAIGVPLTSVSRVSFKEPGTGPSSVAGDEFGTTPENDLSRIVSNVNTATMAGEIDDDDEYGDDASSHEVKPIPKDAFNITAHSASLQLDLLAQVSAAVHNQIASRPSTTISDASVIQAVETYEASVSTLKSMVNQLLQIARDRDAYWQARVDREISVRRLWEESMARVALEQEELETKIGESELKRKRTKKALKEALEENMEEPSDTAVLSPAAIGEAKELTGHQASLQRRKTSIARARRKSTIEVFTELSDSDSDGDEEFFDAVGAGEVEVVDALPASVLLEESRAKSESKDAPAERAGGLVSSFKGYEDPVRKKLKMDADDRPKISLWGILKSMIGKDMTKMTLPVSFNEPTSLLQRVAEDMEYTDLLDTAAARADSTERMVYVAAFAASEYASTIGRVAKPFNPLLGETYEHARPDKGYRFFVEQVSHHPPVGAAWAESARWDYYGESAVRSKFYGKSFDINPLGTWFLKLRPTSGGEELYTWKKVTSSVIGIITGSPTVDNYGAMEIKNWTTGETCLLDFKPRGWKASSAYQVTGKVTSVDGRTRWSIGGRWNDKIYARLTPGFEDSLDAEKSTATMHEPGTNRAFLVWQAHQRPTGIPFNLTPFVVTLNALPESLRPHLPQTDTRLRPDQRAMEDGEYDFAATEKNRLEEKQRAKRREREAKGEEHVPRWFYKTTHPVTREEYWKTNGEYWAIRDAAAKGGKWERVEEIF